MIIYLPVKESYFDLKSGEFGSRMITKSIDIEEQWKEFYFRNKRTGYMISNLGRVKRPDGSIAFGCSDHDPCPCAAGGAGIAQPLKRGVDTDRLFF